MPEPTLFDDPRVADLLGPSLTRTLASVFMQMGIAEEEIERIRGTGDIDRGDPLWRAFELMQPAVEMRTDFAYRAHCRELLERVRDGKDTRPATAAEIVAFISEGSLRMPLSSALVTLEMRLFKRAFPDQFAKLGFDDLDLYERMNGADADEWEQRLRRRLRQDWRRPDAA